MTKEKEERKIIEEITRYAYYERNMEQRASDEEMKKVREWITKIVELEASEIGYKTQVVLGDIDDDELEDEENSGTLFLEFIRSDEIDGWFKNVSQGLRIFKIGFSESTFENVLKNHKDMLIDPFLRIAIIIFHELRHLRQDLMARTGVSSYISLMYAKENAIICMYPQIYEKNHDSMRLEEDAIMESNKKWRRLYRGDRRLLMQYPSYHIIHMTKKQRDNFAFEKFEKLIQKKGNTKVLKEFPVLLKEYNEDGTKKSLNELVENMKLEIEEILTIDSVSDEEKDILIKDCKEMYFELLYRGIKKEQNFSEIQSLAEAYDKEDRNSLFSDMKVSFEERWKNEKRDIKETGMLEGDKEQEKEIEVRQKYYQSRIDFLDSLQEQQRNKEFLGNIVKAGKKFITMPQIDYFIKKIIQKKEEKNDR